MILITIAEQALLLTPLVLGMHISYRILKITDLTVDGTYVLGAAIFASTINLGIFQAMIYSILAGSFTGIIVAFIQRKNIINDLIAGVLASFMLYSINLQIMGRPNISLLDSSNILNWFDLENWLLPFGLIILLILTSLFILLNSRFGLTLRAFGYNKKLLTSLGKNPEKYRMLGLGISNGLASLSGALAAQSNGFADINMGMGVALIGIGAVVIGRQLIIKNKSHFHIIYELSACLVGIFLYFSALNLLLRFGINPVNLKLALGVILLLALSKTRKERAL